MQRDFVTEQPVVRVLCGRWESTDVRASGGRDAPVSGTAALTYL